MGWESQGTALLDLPNPSRTHRWAGDPAQAAKEHSEPHLELPTMIEDLAGEELFNLVPAECQELVGDRLLFAGTAWNPSAPAGWSGNLQLDYQNSSWIIRKTAAGLSGDLQLDHQKNSSWVVGKTPFGLGETQLDHQENCSWESSTSLLSTGTSRDRDGLSPAAHSCPLSHPHTLGTTSAGMAPEIPSSSSS